MASGKGRGKGDRRERATRQAASAGRGDAPLLSPPPATPRPSHAPSRLVATGLVLVLLVVAGLGAWWLTREGAPGASDRAASGAKVVPPASEYVGAATCSGCHAKEAESWRGSDHDRAMEVATVASVLGDFSGTQYGKGADATRFFMRDGKYFASTQGADGTRADVEIKYTFGVHPLQQYLVEQPGGRLQALGVAWDSRPREAGGQRWFHLYPGREPKAGDPLHWSGLDQNWNFQCAECHSTNLRKAFDPAANTFRTTWSEIDVACESCHGPGSRHVAWARQDAAAREYPAKGLAVALDERRGVTWTHAAGAATAQRSAPRVTSREIDTCARCHARAARFSDEYINGGAPGDSHRVSLLDPGLYWPDGQMREEVYNWGSFVQSRMHAAGVTCSDCHDPHSLKLRAPANAVCAQCHAPATFDVPAHTHHAAGTPGAACASCHMPTATYMVVDPRHDHSMRIPRPDLSVSLGVPNACNACHSKQSPQWAADALHRLWGPQAGQRAFQQFGGAFAASDRGLAGARGPLLALVADRAQPAIVRASALERLAAWSSPPVVAAAAQALNDADANVRRAAVFVLAGSDDATRLRYLPRMLSDPVRVVRMEAANGLAGEVEARVPPEHRAAFATALDEHVAAQNYNADRPEGRLALGNLAARRGDAATAITQLRAAIALDPTFVPAYVNLADVYRTRGAEADAEKTLRDGLARNPQASELHHALGLSLVRQQRRSDGMAELATAARLAPANTRYAYVHAVSLADSGQRAKARQVLEAARAQRPYDREVLEAIVSYATADGDAAAARRAAQALVELDPDNAQYASTLKTLSAGTAPR